MPYVCFLRNPNLVLEHLAVQQSQQRNCYCFMDKFMHIATLMEILVSKGNNTKGKMKDPPDFDGLCLQLP